MFKPKTDDHQKKIISPYLFFSLANLLFLWSGLFSFAALAEDSVELKVLRGDKLIHLCRKYLENPDQWREVARFNRLKNPDLILPGQRVNIPVRLLPGVPIDGVVTFVYGEAKVQKDKKTGWTALTRGEADSQGSRIQTGKASSLELTFEDKNSIFLKPNTDLGLTASPKRGLTYRLNQFYWYRSKVFACWQIR